MGGADATALRETSGSNSLLLCCFLRNNRDKHLAMRVHTVDLWVCFPYGSLTLLLGREQWLTIENLVMAYKETCYTLA